MAGTVWLAHAEAGHWSMSAEDGCPRGHGDGGGSARVMRVRGMTAPVVDAFARGRGDGRFTCKSRGVRGGLVILESPIIAENARAVLFPPADEISVFAFVLSFVIERVPTWARMWLRWHDSDNAQRAWRIRFTCEHVAWRCVVVNSAPHHVGGGDVVVDSARHGRARPTARALGRAARDARRTTRARAELREGALPLSARAS